MIDKAFGEAAFFLNINKDNSASSLGDDDFIQAELICDF